MMCEYKEIQEKAISPNKPLRSFQCDQDNMFQISFQSDNIIS